MPTPPAPSTNLFYPALIIHLAISVPVATAHASRFHANIRYRGTQAKPRTQSADYAPGIGPAHELSSRLRPTRRRRPWRSPQHHLNIANTSLKPYGNAMRTSKPRGGRPLSVTPWQRLLVIARFLTTDASAAEIGREVRTRQGGRLKGPTAQGYLAWWHAQHPDDPLGAIHKAINRAFHDEVADRDASDARRGKQQRRDRPSNRDIVVRQVQAVLGANWSPPPTRIDIRDIEVPDRMGARRRR